jgi:hypothetical protein
MKTIKEIEIMEQKWRFQGTYNLLNILTMFVFIIMGMLLWSAACGLWEYIHWSPCFTIVITIILRFTWLELESYRARKFARTLRSSSIKGLSEEDVRQQSNMSISGSHFL